VRDVAQALEKALQDLAQRGPPIDSISVCGNGEPTLYPDLRQVVDAMKELRDRYMPAVRLAIFSNSSTVGSEPVRETLEQLDVKIMKFDAGSEELIWQLNHPASPVYMGEMVAGLKMLTNVLLASLFVQGKVTNADPDSIDLWIDKVGEIRPSLVQVYSLARGPADPKIEKVNVATLQWIADRLRWRTGLQVEVY
jgi:wyosine [tRNA(Phe)-imidazoG37] synthetase (radical SAM superfamily)